MIKKEEIEQLAANLANPNVCKTTNWIEGYTQCQKDNDWTKNCECKSSIGQTWCCNQCGLPYDTIKSEVTRFEVIDENGRVYTTKDCKVELSYQDNGRTLKVFIKKQS